ncbi:HRDC domain-containing protein [Mucilaginibacter litoreus]|uniref:HRDC domain-containing protein n=1 Tax=Mucilaginibacter litoreus TaxID=1048221 RepID=A0ABW3AV88_9SPHI
MFEQLMDWRDRTARTEKYPDRHSVYRTNLSAIAAKLPQTLKSLSGIKGIGPEKTNRYGTAMLT